MRNFSRPNAMQSFGIANPAAARDAFAQPDATRMSLEGFDFDHARFSKVTRLGTLDFVTP